MPASKELKDLLEAGRPLVSEALGASAWETFEARVVARHEALLPGAPRFHQRGNARLFRFGVPALAFYRVLRDDYGLAPEPAVALLERTFEARYHRLASSSLRLGLARLAFRSRFLRAQLLRSMIRLDEPGGFRMRAVDAEGTLMAFDVRECALVKYLRAQGAPEIGPLFCAQDDLLAADLQGIALVRTETLARGGERCDFRYVRAEEDEREGGPEG